MADQSGFIRQATNDLRIWSAAAWERLIEVQARDEEEARLGRLFNTLMVIGFAILIVLFVVLALMLPLGLTSARVSMVAAAFPVVFLAFSWFCLAQARRGYIRPMIRLYVSVNMITIGVVVWLFDGVYSPAWVLFFWNVTIGGILLAPSSALWMTGGVVSYFLLLLFMTLSGVYTPPLTFGVAGREFVNISCVLIIQVSTVGLLTYLNMRSLRSALGGLRERTGQLLTAQEELVRKEKLAVLGQVAGSVGHELRNPLGVMSNAVYFLQAISSDADETTREYLNILKNEIANSERIVSDLLDSVRAKPPQPEEVRVAELITQTLHKCSVPASVSVQLDIAATLPVLRIDAQQIRQVLRNLISNGTEAMPDGGTLRISARADASEKTVTISVQDSGVGVSPEQLGKLFQPLYTTKTRGIGLGLVVVKNLTEVNGGSVDVYSRLGEGTTFSISLPGESSPAQTA